MATTARKTETPKPTGKVLPDVSKAPVSTAAPAQAEKAETTKAKRPRPYAKGKFGDGNQVITLLATENKKRGASKNRFAVYRTGMTVAEFRKAYEEKGWSKFATLDLQWDSHPSHAFIRVE